MRTGSPGFNGSRLVEAREVRGVTAKSVASLVGVTPAAISQYENGKSTPSSEVLADISDKLEFPERFFFASDRRPRHGTTFFRSRASATKGARQAAFWRLGWVSDITSYLEQYLELPACIKFDPGFPRDPRSITSKDIETSATQLRRYWGLQDGAISDVVLLAERNGVVVSRQRLFEDKEDALSEPCVDSHRDYILLNADKDCSVRSRFDLAHELGHLVLHRHVPADVKELHHKLIEKQANQFAGAFLLPEETFFADFYTPSLEVFERLKPKWKSAIAAMVMRCRDRQLIDENDTQRMFRQYRFRKWHRREPLDDEIPIEQPRLLRQSFDALIESGIQTRADVRRSQPYSQRDVEISASLPKGYLDDTMATIRTLPIRPKNEKCEPRGASAEIRRLDGRPAQET